MEQKQQNDNENWYLINNSLMNTIPDAWSIKEKFILLPVNKWSNEYKRANIGGISCDHSDYYNSEDFNQEVLLPSYPEKDKELLASASPLLHIDKIKAPLFIAQGANDPRVKKSESDQIVEALQKKGIDVPYMVKDDEGHGFYNEENQFDFYRAMGDFLNKHLK